MSGARDEDEAAQGASAGEATEPAAGGPLAKASGAGAPAALARSEGASAAATGAAGPRVEEIVVPVQSAGGLVGLFVSDLGRINQALQQHNAQGYRMVGFSRDVRANFFYSLFQSLCLFVTFFIWCPAPAGLLFFRRTTQGAAAAGGKG